MRPGSFLLAVTVMVMAACSSVPDVVFDDDGGAEGGASSSGSSQNDASTGAPDASRTPVQSSDRGCLHNNEETCCGSSLCDDKKICEGPAKVEQCTTCAYDCPNKRCCVKGGATICVGLLGQCPK